MVLECCVKGCETVARNGLHSFPSNKLLAGRWILAIKAFNLEERLNTKGLTHSYYKVCKKHFQDYDFEINVKGQIVVKAGSVPSLFLPDVDHYTPRISIKPLKPVKRLQNYNTTSTHNKRSKQQSKKHDGNVVDMDDSLENRFQTNTLESTIIDVDIDSVQENGIQANTSENDSDVDVVGLSPQNNTEDRLNERIGFTRSSRRKVTKVTNESRRTYNLSYYKRRVKDLQQKVNSNKINDTVVLNYLSTKFNKQLLVFFDMQLENCSRPKHGRRYTPEQKSLCLAMYKQGPKSYRFKENWCALPTKRTLGRYSADLIFKSGIDDKIFDAVKNIVKDWREKDKMCAFMWDEVAIKQHLDYSQSQDKYEGFVEMIKEKKPIFATHALTFMVRGFEVPFKQSIGYFYTNGIFSFELVELVRLMAKRVLATGLNPILSICDQSNTNSSTVNNLVNPNDASTKQTGGLLQYKVNDHKIIHCYDPPHIIKVVRNNLQTKNLAHFIPKRWQTGDEENFGPLQIAAWDDIREVYELDRRSTQRRLPKLTDEHLKPEKLKMRVSLATQVFSATCGSVMLQYVEQHILPQHFTSTAQLLLFMNDLFDSLNGSDKYVGTLKSSVTKDSIHFEFWEYALSMLQNMFFVDKQTGERNNRSSVLKKLDSTIKGYMEVTKICFDAYIPMVNIRGTTQDGLENFFGCVKSCNQNDKPTASQYRTGYTTMTINNITGGNSLNSNCQPDQGSPMLTRIHDFITECKGQPINSNDVPKNPHLIEIEVDYPTVFGVEPTFNNFNEISVNESQPDLLISCHTLTNIHAFTTTSQRQIVGPNIASQNQNQVYIDDYDEELNEMIVFDPENDETTILDDKTLQSKIELINRGAISLASSRICQNLFTVTKCVECKNNFELMDETAALRSVETVLNSLKAIIPDICYQDSVKEKLMKRISPTQIYIIGCFDHNEEIIQKIKNLCASEVIRTFADNINNILSGKIETLPNDPNSIQKIAYEERKKKKRIGKHSDIYNEQR